MPILNLKISGQENAEKTQLIVNRLTEITQTELHKKPEVTAITVTYIENKNWFINSQSLAKSEKNSFYLDIKITDSTNLKSDKHHFIKAVYEYMENLLDNLSLESYVYIEEVKADAYGYGGKTQELRYIKQ